MSNIEHLKQISNLLRYYIISSTTNAGSGHPTSSLSAVELTASLMFGGHFKYDIKNPKFHNNDRIIFSKGHAAPLLYSLWTAAGVITENELLNLRKFGSKLEGHPTPEFEYVDVATGSLGQGLSIGAGMALNGLYLDNLPYNTFVLLGDGELEEGSNWEALQFAAHYNLKNLTAIVDINKFEQSTTTMVNGDIEVYKKRFEAFGWDTIIINNGNDIAEVEQAWSERFTKDFQKPVALLAKTKKGSGISFLEDKENWHGKALNLEESEKAIRELGFVKKDISAEITQPEKVEATMQVRKIDPETYKTDYKFEDIIGVRKAYGKALLAAAVKNPNIVVLDGGTDNSTFSQEFAKVCPERFFQCYIAEQNMVGVATGLSKMGKVPYVSTFAAFFTRAFDQIRMAAYSESNIKFVGSHAGVSIGEDGSSQMALEDIALFRSVLNSVVLYPSDPVALTQMVLESSHYQGNVYIRSTRKDTPIIYSEGARFELGGSKILKESVYDVVTVLAAGVTVHEALAAHEQLAAENIFVRVVDLYSIKPIDIKTVSKCIRETKSILIVEDHYSEGGIYEAVKSALGNIKTRIYSMSVNKMPHSGKPEELMDYEEISRKFIYNKVKEILNTPN